MKLNYKIDKVVVVLVIIIMAGVAQMYMIGTKVINDSTHIEDVEFKIQQEYVRSSKYNEILTSYLTISNEGLVTDVKSLLPTADNFLPVVEDLEKIGKLSGNDLVMRLGDVRLTKEGFETTDSSSVRKTKVGTIEANGVSFDYIEIEARLRGDYNQLVQFFSLFNQSKYYMNVSSMGIIRTPVGGKNLIDTNLTIQVFVQKVINSIN